MKPWEIIADNLSKAGFSLGWVSVLDSEEGTTRHFETVRKTFTYSWRGSGFTHMAWVGKDPPRLPEISWSSGLVAYTLTFVQ
jgi:hypothetical protein